MSYEHVDGARWQLKLCVEFATFLGECMVLLAALFQMINTITHLFHYLQCYLTRFATMCAL